ncbi:MAG: sensor histidine kinase [Actinomycetes bacterium]
MSASEPPAVRAGRPASVRDVALALVLVAVAQVDVWRPDLAFWGDDPVPGARPLNALLLLVVAGAVAWRRSAPLPALVVAMAAVAAQAVTSGDAPIGLLLVGPVLALVYAVGCYGTRAEAWTGLAVTAAAIAVHELFDADIRSARDVGEASYWWLVVASTWLVGRYVGSRRRGKEAAEQARREQERAAAVRREAVAAERLRIANELHDVVAHSVSVMALQAGAALELLDRSPDRVREPLQSIERAARDALVEMGALVGLLRASGRHEPVGAQPRLADLPDLAGRVSAAGLAVEVRSAGAARRLPPGVELSAFRIVQESLTNALRHARGATCARVLLDYRADELRVTVRDDGRGGASRLAGSAGHGLVGMRERAEMYGGGLQADAGPDGGFVVEARLPLGEAGR